MAKYTVYFGETINTENWEDNKREFSKFSDARDFYMSCDSASFCDEDGYWIEEKTFGKTANGKPSIFASADKYNAKLLQCECNVELLNERISECEKDIAEKCDSVKRGNYLTGLDALINKRENLVTQRDAWAQALSLLKM